MFDVPPPSPRGLSSASACLQNSCACSAVFPETKSWENFRLLMYARFVCTYTVDEHVAKTEVKIYVGVLYVQKVAVQRGVKHLINT